MAQLLSIFCLYASDMDMFMIVWYFLLPKILRSCLFCCEWRINTSVNWAIIGSVNCLLPVWRQAITWNNKGIKTGSGGVCCHNARGRVRNRKSNPEGVSPRDMTYCSHKPECIVTTNPDRSVLITIITWHFQFRPVYGSILHLKYDYRARSESRFACYSHCYVTWYPLTTGIVASQCPSARDAVLVTRYLTPFISACLNSILRFLPQ